MISYTSTIFALILTAIVQVNAAGILNKKYCRKDESIARCVDEPLMAEDEDLWCPYHTCGPSYVPAPECPPDQFQATHKCTTNVFNDPIYRCIADRVHKDIMMPLNCEKTNTCTNEIRACACEQITPEREVLSPVWPVSPVCPEKPE